MFVDTIVLVRIAGDYYINMIKAIHVKLETFNVVQHVQAKCNGGGRKVTKVTDHADHVHVDTIHAIVETQAATLQVW